MEEASIHNLLVSLPSQASNFALACVGQMLEDHIQNPNKMTRNLKRIGSVVSEWGLTLSGDVNECGDAGSFLYGPRRTGFAKRNPALLTLPMKIRHRIFSYLSDKDLISLRLVSSKVQFDVDYGVGLPVIMDTSCESIKWLQCITTRKCFVKNLENFVYFNFLPKPDRMETLIFHEYIPVSPNMLDLVLRKFASLSKITFHSQEFLEMVNGREIKPIRSSIHAELLSVLDQKRRVIGINLQFNEMTLTTKWSLELKPQTDEISEEDPLKRVQLKMPYNQFHHQKDCIGYLEGHANIRELRSDLCGISSESYIKLVNQNATTLTKLYLLNIYSTGSSFDCKMLMQCKNICLLVTSGEAAVTQPEGSSYLSIVEVKSLRSLPKLQTVKLENVYVASEDYTFLRYEFGKTVCIKKSICGGEKVFEISIIGTEESRRHALKSESQNKWWESLCEYGRNDDSESSDLEEDEDEDMINGSDSDKCGNEIASGGSVGSFIRGIPVEIWKGVAVTAWIAFC